MKWQGTPEALGQMARDRLDFIWQKRLRPAYPMIQYATPGLVFNKRLKATAGRAFIESKPQYIDVSNDLLWLYPQEFHDTIIPHEAAHLAAFTRYTDDKHGKGWKLVMAYLGLSPDVYHTMVNTYRNPK